MSIPILDEDQDGKPGMATRRLVDVGSVAISTAVPAGSLGMPSRRAELLVFRRSPHELFAVDRSTGTRIESSLWSSVHQLGGGLEKPNLDPRA